MLGAHRGGSVPIKFAVGAALRRRPAPGGREGLQPGVERGETPGIDEQESPNPSGGGNVAQTTNRMPHPSPPVGGAVRVCIREPGVRLRFTPGLWGGSGGPMRGNEWCTTLHDVIVGIVASRAMAGNIESH